MKEARLQFWEWLRPLKESGMAREVYAKVGRGIVVVFDVDSHETLHRLATEWGELIPADLEITPLLGEEVARAALAKSGS